MKAKLIFSAIVIVVILTVIWGFSSEKEEIIKGKAEIEIVHVYASPFLLFTYDNGTEDRIANNFQSHIIIMRGLPGRVLLKVAKIERGKMPYYSTLTFDENETKGFFRLVTNLEKFGVIIKNGKEDKTGHSEYIF